MPRFQTNRQQILRRYRKPYSKTRMFAVRKARAYVSQARIGGAAMRMSGGLPPPPEVKTYDTVVAATTVNGDWFRYSPESTLAGILPGNTSSGRVGRKIRVVGIVVRLEVTTQGVNPVTPWTFDMLWDKQPNGASPNLAAGSLNSPYSGTGRTSLPNPNFTQRYSFIRRIQSSPDASVSFQTLDATIKCDKIVSFDGNAGTMADLEQNNFLLLGSTSGAGLIVQGNIRVLYVDA